MKLRKKDQDILRLQTVYKRDKHGNVLSMEFEYSGNKRRCITGVVGGARKVGAWTEAKPKNVGRANETTAEDQALLELQSKRDKALDRAGYFESIDDIDNAATVPVPMLAHTFDWNKKKPELKFPIAGQPKLNGARCLTSKGELYTRYGNKWMNAAHIEQEVCQNINVCKGLREPDGEFYNHDLRENLDDLMSIVRKEKPTAEDRAKSANIVQYHLYDYVMTDEPNANFVKRWLNLRTMVEQRKKATGGKTCLRIVPFAMLNSYEEVWAYYIKCLADGYEGIMLRDPDASYQRCRTKAILKMKPRFHAEFTVERALEGKGKNAGVLSRFECIAKKDTLVEHKWLVKKGTKFKVNMRGPIPLRKKMWEERDKYPGKLITVSCAYVTQNGVPFHNYYESFVGTERTA